LRLFCCLLVAFALRGTCSAQPASYYKTVNRVTWVVENIDKVRAAWEALGLSNIEEYPNIQFAGEFRGRPVTIYAWQITGQLGDLTIDMIQPAEGQANAYTSFLAKHGDGMFSIVHVVPDQPALDKEILRMKEKGVGILQQESHGRGQVSIYFDTEPEGKFAMGLVLRPPGKRTMTPGPVSHFGFVVRDAVAVSAYWARLGFPGIPMQQALPRADSRYKGDPLSLTFEVGFQGYSQFRYEWICPPPSPPNIYADFLNKHRREGIQHIGIEVADLPKRVEAFKQLGYQVLQSGSWGKAGKRGAGEYAYMDTDPAGGTSVELVHRY
jgi:catechol 2,3-dioxygenase-like lactoylglutathione lyase family enzyme